MPLNSAAEEKLVGLCEVRASLVYILSSSHSCTVGPCLKGEEGGGQGTVAYVHNSYTWEADCELEASLGYIAGLKRIWRS